MSNQQATIKDIARQLNLSISTVSRALRNAPDVNPSTREAVLAISEKMHYQPNRLALSLREKQTHIIGVIVPNLDYVLSSMVKGIDEAALEAGYTVMVCQSNESFGREILNTSRMLDSLVDGLIISVSSETKTFEHIKKFQERKIPIISFDRMIPELNAPYVILNNEEGGFIATEHLILQGYKNIALLAGPENLGISNSRMKGFLDAMKKYKRKVNKNHVVHCAFNQDYAFLATQELLRMKNRPDAIFTISDRMAIGAMLAIKEKGLKMPSDIGLVGFNNEPLLSLLSPSISSVEQPCFEMGKIAAKLFIESLHSDSSLKIRSEIMKPKLFVRESSKKF